MSHAGTLEPEHPHGSLKPPGDTTGLFGVFRRRYLLRLLVRKELRVRYQASAMGLVWSYIKPLVRFLTYLLVVGKVMGFDRYEGYPYHVFAGLIMVSLFTETLGAGTKSVVKNKSLVRKMNVPRETFPVASLIVTSYHALPQYLILVIACLLGGWDPTPESFAAGLLGIAIIITFSLAVGLAFSALNVWFRDFSNFVEVISQLVMWSTPMIYPFDRLLQSNLDGIFLQIYLCNPVAQAVMLNQELFWLPMVGDPSQYEHADHLMLRGGITLVVCLGLVGLAQMLFRRLEGRFAEHL